MKFGASFLPLQSMKSTPLFDTVCNVTLNMLNVTLNTLMVKTAEREVR